MRLRSLFLLLGRNRDPQTPTESVVSHQDPTCLTPPNTHHQDLRGVFDWLLERADFAAVGFRCTCTWTPRSLTVAALLWAWSAEETLTARFTAARKIALTTLGLDALTAATYQAFLKLLRAWSAALAVVLIAALRCRMRGDLADRFQVDGFAIFGVDGSRLELPRTASNQAGFAPQATRRASK